MVGAAVRKPRVPNDKLHRVNNDWTCKNKDEAFNDKDKSKDYTHKHLSTNIYKDLQAAT